MSGMAGNVTAFNTVLTFDIYQSLIKKDATDKHYLMVGKVATIFGILASIGIAYVARGFNNIMDFLQLVFGFVNAPLFATFFLGMFWKRTTANGAFFGLLSGTIGAAITHGLTVAEGKGGWITNLYEFPSAMSQAFNIAGIAFAVCFIVTIAISLFTQAKPISELKGLVYEKGTIVTPNVPFYKQPWILGAIVLTLTLILNILFF